MISNAKFSRKSSNEAYNAGDTIGVYLHLLACKPEFMRVGVIPRGISSLIETDSVIQGRDGRVDSCQDVITEESKKE